MADILHRVGIKSSSLNDAYKALTTCEGLSAWWIAAQIVVKGETPTYRRIARAMGVEASTVLRWFPGGSLISEAKALAGSIEKSRLFDNLGPDPSLEE